MHQQHPGNKIPWFEANLEITVVAPRGGISQVQCSRAAAADVFGLAEDGAGDIQLRIQVGTLAERKAGGDHRAGEVFASGHAQATVIHERAIALARGVQLVAQRVEHHRMHGNALVQQGDGYAKMRNAAQVIVRAVQRVDDPGHRSLAKRTAFFGEDRVVGIGTPQLLDDLRFGELVDFGNEIQMLLFDDMQAVNAVHVAQDDVACSARSTRRDRDSGSGHGFDLKRAGLRLAILAEAPPRRRRPARIHYP